MDNLHEPQQAEHTDSVAEQESTANVQTTEGLGQENPIQEQELTAEEPIQKEEVQTEEPIQNEEVTTEEIVQKEDDEQLIQDAPSEEEETKLSDDFYDHLNKEEVVETLEEVVANPDVVKIKEQVSLLKIRFLHLNKEDKEQHFQAFLAEGGNKEDYVYEADALAVRFGEAFDRYKANKTRYAEELEQAKQANLAQKTALLEELKVLVESTDSLKQIYDRFKEIQITWKEIGAVPQANVGELWQNYHFYVEKFFDKIRINRELRDLDFKKNLEIKLEICEKTEALLLEPSIMKSFKLLKQYHQEWKESGYVEDDKKEELWNRFKAASDKISQIRKDYYDKINQQQEENYRAKLAVCESLEEITNVKLESIKQAGEISNAVNELFKTWRTLGPAPQKVHDEVWERFRKGLNDFSAAKKQYFTQLNEEQVNNYNLKLNLCIQAEAIALRKDWKKATEELQNLQKEWKGVGAINSKQGEPLWQRFRKACDEFFAAKLDFFKNISKHEVENLQKKEALIKQVTEFQFGDSQTDNFAALKDFQRQWTEIGYTASSEKDRLWEAFRTAVSAKFDELKSLPNMEDKTKYTQRISEIMEKEASMAGKFLAKEANILQDKIRKLTDEVNLWENNLNFFANSKNIDVLRGQFGKKIENARLEIAALQEKLTVIKEKDGRTNDTTEKEKSNKPKPKRKHK
ncbi:MAG: DUF349 domain-containing protein [Lentimicrobiaceae bacterium]|nr:DUF349 domain-containing protein [Lentimicrobiaceae bacterium]